MLAVAAYEVQRARWPSTGRVILAQYDEDTIVVYQAFRPAIALPAVAHQRFVAPFSLDRMSWIKPNFLWMMYRSSWATAAGQEHVLAVRIRRAGFDTMLAAAVGSSFQADRWTDRPAWEDAVRRSDVRSQWDPDHGPGGAPVERRALQLGLRRTMLRRYVEEWTVSIEDITAFVAEQRAVRSDLARLLTPVEQVYPSAPEDPR